MKIFNVILSEPVLWVSRRILLIALFLFVSLTCSYAQTKDTSSIDNWYAGPTVDTFYVQKTAAGVIVQNYNTRFVIIQNQSTTTGDTLWFWFNNDSTKSKKYLLPGQRFQKNKLLKSINTRSGSSNQIRRPIIVEAQ